MSYIIKINPKYEAFRDQIESLIKIGRPASMEIIYEGRNTLYRFKALPDSVRYKNKSEEPMPESIPMVVKEFKKPNPINAYAYTTVRTSKARRSYENGLKMLSLGFETPEPIAYCEERRGLKLLESCYVSRELTGATEMRHWEDHPDSTPLVKAFAEEIKRLHEAGVWHKDFSPGNVLYTGNQQTGYKFHYVDLNRMKFDEHRHGKLMSMFRSINLNPEETKRLARYYAEATGQQPEAVEREALTYLEGYFRERSRKATFKKKIGIRK